MSDDDDAAVRIAAMQRQVGRDVWLDLVLENGRLKVGRPRSVVLVVGGARSGKSALLTDMAARQTEYRDPAWRMPGHLLHPVRDEAVSAARGRMREIRSGQLPEVDTLGNWSNEFADEFFEPLGEWLIEGLGARVLAVRDEAGVTRLKAYADWIGAEVRGDPTLFPPDDDEDEEGDEAADWFSLEDKLAAVFVPDGDLELAHRALRAIGMPVSTSSVAQPQRQPRALADNERGWMVVGRDGGALGRYIARLAPSASSREPASRSIGTDEILRQLVGFVHRTLEAVRKSASGKAIVIDGEPVLVPGSATDTGLLLKLAERLSLACDAFARAEACADERGFALEGALRLLDAMFAGDLGEAIDSRATLARWALEIDPYGLHRVLVGAAAAFPAR